MYYKNILPSNFEFDSKSLIHIELIRSIISNFIRIMINEEIKLIYPSKFETEKYDCKFIYFQLYDDIDYTIGYHLFHACKLILTDTTLIEDYKFNKELLTWFDTNRTHTRVELHNQLNVLVYFKEHQRIINYIKENASGYLKYVNTLKVKKPKKDYSPLFTVNNYQTFEYNFLTEQYTDYELTEFINTPTNSTQESLDLSIKYFEKVHRKLTNEFYLKNKVYEQSEDKLNYDKYKEKLINYFSGKSKLVYLLKTKFKSLKALSNSNIKISSSDSVDNKIIDVVRINQFNMNLINNNLFQLFELNNHTIKLNKQSINSGIKLGKNILDKLQYRTVENEIKDTRLEYGRIDKKLLPELIWNNNQIHYKQTIEKHLNQHIILSVDYSKSMLNKHSSILTLLTGLIYAIDKINNLKLTVYLRYTINDEDDIKPTLLKIYDKDKNNFNDVIRLFPYLKCKGGSPEGILHNEVLKEIKTMNNVYFINISDGKPEFFNTKIKYCDDLSKIHTKSIVNSISKNTSNMLSFFIGNNEDKSVFNDIYGKYGNVINESKLNDISNIINKFLIIK